MMDALEEESAPYFFVGRKDDRLSSQAGARVERALGQTGSTKTVLRRASTFTPCPAEVARTE